MKTTSAALLSLATVCTIGLTQTAQADTYGLRLTPSAYGLTLSAPEGGLRLNLSLPGDKQVLGPLFSPTSASLGKPASPNLTLTDRTTLSADWMSLGNGFRSSVGLSWRQPQGLGTDRPLRDNDSTTPFVSLGWRGEPFRNSGWKMSAEFGAYFSGYGECRSDQYCLKGSNAGLNPNANPNGIRWSPFISFGATLSY